MKPRSAITRTPASTGLSRSSAAPTAPATSATPAPTISKAMMRPLVTSWRRTMSYVMAIAVKGGTVRSPRSVIVMIPSLPSSPLDEIAEHRFEIVVGRLHLAQTQAERPGHGRNRTTEGVDIAGVGQQL